MVVHDSGVCIDSATVRVIEGQALDFSATQRTPCDAWGYDGGFFIRDLVPGIPLTIRATAPGFLSVTRTITPTLGPQMAFLFSPTKASAQGAITR
jgi:hypothetical protein